MILKHGGWSCCQVKLSHSRVVTTINSTLGQDFLIINIKLNILICSHSWQNHADHHSKVDTHLTDIIMDATTSLADDLQDLQLDRVDNKLKVYINWIVIKKNTAEYFAHDKSIFRLQNWHVLGMSQSQSDTHFDFFWKLQPNISIVKILSFVQCPMYKLHTKMTGTVCEC